MDGKTNRISETNHEIAWWVFRYYGLRLKDDNTVTTLGGRKVGELKDAHYNDGAFRLTYYAHQPMEYIPLSITIKRKQDKDGA